MNDITLEFYDEFISECKSIIVESVYNSREELLRGKWELGKLIAEQNNNFERANIYGKQIVERVATDLGRSSSDIWRCLQFYKTFPEETFSQTLEKLPDGKNISWAKVIVKCLPKAQEKRIKNTLFQSIEVPIGERVVNGNFNFENKLSEPVTVKIYVKREEFA